MFRNQYDSDVTVWSPQGRIHQVEYAMEAVKQGSATVGIKSNNAVVLVALKRAQNDLSSYQPKIFPADDQIGVSVSGLMADARLLIRFLQSEALDYRWAHEQVVPINQLSGRIESKLQTNTQIYGRRPFGVGMLLAGFDDNGTYLIQTCPSAHTYICHAMALGARSQSARTYLENHLKDFPECNKDALIKHALTALKETLPNDMTLNARNTSVGVVVLDGKFEICEDESVANYLSNL